MPAERAPSLCPTDEVLFAWASGQESRGDDDAQRGERLAHLSMCDTCRELVAALALSLRPDNDGPKALASATTELQPAFPAENAKEALESTLLARFAPGTPLLGAYTVVSLLGRGGMGIVLRATPIGSASPNLAQDVAIKVLYGAASRSAEMRVRLFREARLVKEIRSPHVAAPSLVGLLDTGEPYIVMEWLEGEDLATYLAREKTVPLMQSIDWIIQICAALQSAHERGIVHRDLKPSNVFLHQPQGGPIRIKLLDFGISKRVSTHEEALSRSNASEHLTLTKAHSLLGTPAYMSPEQVHNARDVGPATDLWAVGVVFCELITGQNPFAKASLGGTLAAVITEPTPVLEIPNEVQRLVAGCLEKDPAHRFQDAGELRAKWSSVQNTPASELSTALERLPMSLGSKHPARFAAAATLATVLVLGIGFFSLSLRGATASNQTSQAPASDAVTSPSLVPPVVSSAPSSVSASAFTPSAASSPARRELAHDATRFPAAAVSTKSSSATALSPAATNPDDTAVVFGTRR